MNKLLCCIFITSEEDYILRLLFSRTFIEDVIMNFFFNFFVFGLDDLVVIDIFEIEESIVFGIVIIMLVIFF